jgi:thioredoxin reductase (NADPH)
MYESTPWVVARPSTPAALQLRELLLRNKVAVRWLDPGTDALVALLGAERAFDDRPLPLVVLPDGTVIEPPAQHQTGRDVRDEEGAARYVETARWRAQVAAAFGLPTVPQRDLYDVVVLGAGPAGLTAAVNAASEGLSTLVLERVAPGGQAGTSASIENYPGFPQGISGAELAAKTYEQAVRFGAEILVGVELAQVARKQGLTELELTSGPVVRNRSVVVAPGVAYRRLDAPGVEELLGAGVHYGSAPAKAVYYRDRDVAIVGAANSAGQAALHLASYARRVTIVCRGPSLETRMSRYLVDRIEASANIDVRVGSEVVRAEGDGRLESLLVRETATQEEARLPVDGLFVLIGGEPLTEGVKGWLRRDANGFLMTGRDLFDEDDDKHRPWWPLERDPYPLETSEPGVFVAGDVRHGSSKRVASAVGEGAMAVQLIQQYLADPSRQVVA